MNAKGLRAAAAIATAAAVALGSTAAASAATTPYPMQSKAYGKRYCEMGAAYLEGSGVRVDIYNTFAQNDCPAADWAGAITSSAMDAAKSALGAVAVVINGPRWWAFDSIGGHLDPTVVSFGNVAMNKAATLNFAGLAAPPAFTAFTVHRTSTWVWNKGTYIRILTAPDGKRYAMQAWTTQVSPLVTEKSLNTLAKGKSPLLKLPTGWKYSAVKASKKTTVVAPGTMTILQDNLKNTYSLLP